MNPTYHILNGDALKAQFPSKITGDLIVARECLVDGSVQADSLEALFAGRATFIAETYSEGYSVEDYYQDTVSEFDKIRHIPNGSTVHLWFEDDLFCQVNCWFVASLLSHSVQDCAIFLVRPAIHTRYGFGGLTHTELAQTFADRVQVEDIGAIASLWEAYQADNLAHLQEIAHELRESFPFILDAVEAHMARIPTANSLGRPKQTLLNIMTDLKTDAFEPIFQEFCKREPLYGFGDLQVRRLLAEM